MQGIDLPFIREQFDDDNGAGKGQGHRHIEGSQGGQTQPQGDQKAEQRGKQHLSQASGQGHRSHGTDQMQIQP